MRKCAVLALWLMLLLLSGMAAEAQTTVSGSNVQDSTGVQLASGQWCFGATCLTVTNGAFSGSVTPGTGTVTIVNASSATILTVTGVTITGASWNWGNYVVPYLATFNGLGAPYLPCNLSAQYTQLNSTPADAVWQCQIQGGQTSWVFLGPPKPAGPGIISGLGAPALPAVVPTMYVRTDTPSVYYTEGVTGTISTTWGLVSGGGGGGLTALTQDVAASGSGSVPATVQGIHTVAIPNLSVGYLHFNGSTFVWDTPGSGSGGVGSGNACQLAKYFTTGTNVAGDPLVCDNGTTFTYTGTSGYYGASYTSTGSAPGADFLGTGTANIGPTSVTTFSGWVGPTSGFPAFLSQMPSGPPSSPSVYTWTVPTSANGYSISAETTYPLVGTYTNIPTSDGLTGVIGTPVCKGTLGGLSSCTFTGGISVSFNGGPAQTSVNFSSTTPGPPSGYTNCVWQNSGTTWSCFVPTGGGGGGGGGGTVNGSVRTGSYSASIVGEYIRMNNGGSPATVTLPATVVTGYNIVVQRDPTSTATVTINPNGISYDGVTTQLPPGEAIYLWTDGTGYHSSVPTIYGLGMTTSPSSTGNMIAANETAGMISGARACSDTSASTTAQSCSTNPSFTVAAGVCLEYTTTTSNTGSLTLSVNGGSALPVTKWLGTTLAANDVRSGHTIPVCLNSSASAWDLSVVGNAPSAVQLNVANTWTALQTFSAGISVASGITATSDGVHAGYNSLVGNTTTPSLDTNTAGFMGPNSASFTAYAYQLGSSGPAAPGVLQVGALASGISQLTSFTSTYFTHGDGGGGQTINPGGSENVECGGIVIPAGGLSVGHVVIDVTTGGGTGGGNNSDFGFYNASGTLVAHTGATTMNTTGSAITFALSGGTQVIPAGKAYVCFVTAGTTLVLGGSNGATFLPSAVASSTGVSGALPSTITPPSDSPSASGAVVGFAVYP